MLQHTPTLHADWLLALLSTQHCPDPGLVTASQESGSMCIRVLAPCNREFLRLQDLFGLDGRTAGFLIAK